MSIFVRHLPNWEELEKSGHVIRKQGFAGEFAQTKLVFKLIKNALRCGERVPNPQDLLSSSRVTRERYEAYYKRYIGALNSSNIHEEYTSFYIDYASCDLSKSAQQILEDEREDD